MVAVSGFLPADVAGFLRDLAADPDAAPMTRNIAARFVDRYARPQFAIGSPVVIDVDGGHRVWGTVYRLNRREERGWVYDVYTHTDVDERGTRTASVIEEVAEARLTSVDVVAQQVPVKPGPHLAPVRNGGRR